MGFKVRDDGEHRAWLEVRTLFPGITPGSPTALGQIKLDCVKRQPILFVKTRSAGAWLLRNASVVSSGSCLVCRGVVQQDASALTLRAAAAFTALLAWKPAKETSEGDGLAVASSSGSWHSA